MTSAAREVQAANEALVREYLDWQRNVNKIVDGSARDYTRRMESFLEWIGATPIGGVQTESIERWVQRPRRYVGAGSPATIAKDLTVVRSFYNWACGRQRVLYNPCASGVVAKPRIRNKQPKPIPQHEWRRIWGSPLLSDDLRVALGLGFFVGLRSEEIVSLEPPHVSRASGQLVSFVRKGGGEDVTPYADMVEVFAEHMPQLLGPDGSASFLEPLHALHAQRSDRPRLLPWRDQYDAGGIGVGARKAGQRTYELADEVIPVTWLRTRMRPIIKSTGWHFTPHMLRHSCCTYLLMAGVPIHIVSVLLNHSSIVVTQRYGKVAGTALRSWREQRDGRLRLP